MNEVIEREASDVVPAPAANPMQMLQIAVSRGVDTEQLKQLMDLSERWEKNEARKAYHRAFSDFKAEAVNVIRNKTVNDGPLKGKSYAELFAVVDAATPALSKHGLSASWRITKDEKDWIEVTCTITHELGHSESVSMGAMPDTGGAKNSIQARASTVTYLERYTLLAATGLAAKGQDDDGRSAGKPEVVPDPKGKELLEKCGSLHALTQAWASLTKEQRKTLAGVKDECKARIEAADREAASA